ncbi:MAG: type VI secretion system-associated protein TagF [Pseudomonadota bacterium]
MSARCGWTGKLPSSGDFISRRVPAEFRVPWERWLDGVIVASRANLGAAWRQRFLCAPAWRFVLAPGVLSAQGWAGVMVPSVDCVGRFYPLTLVGGFGNAPIDAEQALAALQEWLNAAEQLAMSALMPATDPQAFDEAVAALAPLPAPPQAAGAVRAARSAWQARDSEIAPGWTFSVEGMPGPERYGEMLAGGPASEAALP